MSIPGYSDPGHFSSDSILVLIKSCIANCNPETEKPNFKLDIAPALWGNPPLFDLTGNLTQCREHGNNHMEQLCDWSKVGRSLGLTSGGQMSEPRCCVRDK